MRKNIIILIAIMCLGLSGCKGKTAEAAPINNNDNIAESEANTEYDSIEDFLTRSNVSVFMMDSNSSIIATYSNAAAFSAVDKKVSVAESYIAITYECETNGETFVNGRPKVPCQLSGRFRGRSIFSPFF